MATATNPNLHARTLDPLERVRVRNFAYSRGPRLKRTKASRGRKRQKRRRKRDTGFPAVLHSWGRMNGRPLHARTRIKLVPERKRAATRGLDVSARDLHWMASCHVGVWTSIHARSGRIKASHVQFHGTKIFFRGISILLPLHAWNLCLVPSFGPGFQTFTPSLVDESSFATQCTGKRVRDTRGSTSDIWFDSWRRRPGMSDNEERQWSWREKCN